MVRRRVAWGRTAGVGLTAVLVSLGASSCGDSPLEDTTAVPGDLRRFDPVGSLPDIAAYAGAGAKLVELEALFVREDGTQDLQASYVANSRVGTYEFVRPTQDEVDTSAPVGARGEVAPYETVVVTISNPHFVSQSVNGGDAQLKKHQGMQRQRLGPATEQAGLPAPPCTFAQLWTDAKARGAPAGAVAEIAYGPAGYEFRIREIDVDLRFNAQCELAPT